MAGWTDIKMKWDTRLCTVNDEVGYFHIWEPYSEPIGASMLRGGHPGGVFSRVYGIVEFENGVRRVNPTDIKFCDEENQILHDWNKFRKEKENDQN